jgi:hypothetical protein
MQDKVGMALVLDKLMKLDKKDILAEQYLILKCINLLFQVVSYFLGYLVVMNCCNRKKKKKMTYYLFVNAMVMGLTVLEQVKVIALVIALVLRLMKELVRGLEQENMSLQLHSLYLDLLLDYMESDY